MSDNPITLDAPQSTENPNSNDPNPKSAPAPAQETDWKAMARQWEDRSKANKSALDELTAKFETATSERDELAGKIQEFETKATRAEAVVSISEEYGVPASALRGDTADDLKAHAEVLKSLITPRASTVPGATTKPSASPANPAQQAVRQLFGK